MPLRAWNLQNLFIMHTNKNLIKIVHVEKSVIRVVESTKRPPVDIITVINCTPKGRNEYMKNIIKKQSLRITICMMLVLAMVVTILPENVQAASSAASFTTDLVDLNGWEMIKSYGKAGKGGVSFPSTSLGIPEGETVYVIDGRSTCEGKHLYRVYYEGRVWSAYSKNILNLKDTAWVDAYVTKQNRELKGKKVKAKKDAVVGNVMDPLH